MWIAPNLKRCMSICDIKRKLTNEYRSLIAQWACTRYRYVIYARHYMWVILAKSMHLSHQFISNIVVWKNFRSLVSLWFCTRWQFSDISRVYVVVYIIVSDGRNKSGRLVCPVNAKKDALLVQLWLTFIDIPTSALPILVSLIRITKLRWFATHMCPNLMAVLPWKLLNIVIDSLLIR